MSTLRNVLKMITIGKYSQIVRFKKSSFNILKCISWFGTVTSILGAFLVANGIFLHGFSVFAVGAICWLFVARMQNNNAMFVLELVFLTANINGVLNYI